MDPRSGVWQVAGQGSAVLGQLTEPLPVRLAAGDATGSTTIRLKRHGTVWSYPI